MEYLTEIKECVDNDIFKREDIFDWDQSPLKELLEKYYVFCRGSLDIESKHCDISPNIIIVTNKLSVNAEAARTKTHFYIAINLGLLKYCNENYIENEALTTYFIEKFSNTVGKFDNPANLMAFQICTQFTYYHELAHLFQFSSKANIASIQERNDKESDSEFSITDHILEINADTYASVAVATHIEQYIGRIFKENATEDNTAETFIFFCCCLLNYTLGFSEKGQPIYFNEHSHPHPFLRLVNSILNIVHHVENSPYFKERNIDLKARNLFRTVVDTYKDLEDKKIFKTKVSKTIEENVDLQEQLSKYLHSLIQFDAKEYTDAMDVWNAHIT
jgi:hypothetical protein